MYINVHKNVLTGTGATAVTEKLLTIQLDIFSSLLSKTLIIILYVPSNIFKIGARAVKNRDYSMIILKGRFNIQLDVLS